MANLGVPTIIDLKVSFLRSQIQLLSHPLRPSSNVLSTITSEENALRKKSIDETLYKLNALLKKHNKLSYGPQALRHVAEQVDKLYWSAGERSADGAREEWAEVGCDLRDEDIVEQLPGEWSEEAEAEAPEQAARYSELQNKLVELNEKRRVARERLERYRAAKELLVPFGGEVAGLQDNLVTKNGEVEMELERMRMLMLRVERGLQGLEERQPEDREADNMDIDVEEDGHRRLDALLKA